jgi:4-hydroxythreonine-4-phosphate dehydrogenase
MATDPGTGDRRPLIGLTIGDPAGIGPEVVAAAVRSPAVQSAARVVVIGDAGVLERAQAVLGIRDELLVVQHPALGRFVPGQVTVVDPNGLDGAAVEWGRVQPAAGRAAFAYVRRGVELCLAGELDALATAPINKEALRLGGVPYLDHTAILKALTDSPDLLTMFTIRGRNLRVFFMARHMSLRASCDEVTQANVYRTIVQARDALRRFELPVPRIAVAALNPHAGEHGMFGTEEQTEIAPAVERARGEGIDARGPIPADAVFHQLLQGRYDAVISLYHDQGHVASKTLDFERTVSVTTGMPILRTSVDHGTAFDIAGKGVASAVSIEEAVLVAAELAPYVRRNPIRQ